jgi:NADPH-dependent 2,4-dienoyl-CoA reductase/sulfur reductase-like enzyme
MARIVVIGGVAAGMSAASQARRRDPSAEVVVLERGRFVSYGACGMPYNLLDPRRSMDDLVVITPERFRSERRIDVRTRHEAARLDLGRKVVAVRDLEANREYELGYDALVVATGAQAVRPPLPGIDLPGVFLLRELADGHAMKRFIAGDPHHAIIIGAGYIGMEMAEALRGRGLDVTVLEKADQILPGFARPIVDAVHSELKRNDVRVETAISVERMERAARRLSVITDRGPLLADLVLVSVGVRPNVALARAAGMVIGETGAIAVDDAMRTSAPAVFAAGDCAEARHLVTGRPAYVPLGTTANKQGRVAGANAAGGDERFGGIVGSAAFKVFELEVGRTGLGPVEVARLGLEAVPAVSRHRSRGHAYPGAKEITTVLFAERSTHRLLGAQMAGGEGVTGRIDVLATGITARMTVDDVEQLDLAYAPPLAPVYDPVLIAAGVATKELGKSPGPAAGVERTTSSPPPQDLASSPGASSARRRRSVP